MTRWHKALIALSLAAVLLAAAGWALLKSPPPKTTAAAPPAAAGSPAGGPAEAARNDRNDRGAEPAPWESVRAEAAPQPAGGRAPRPPVSLPDTHTALSLTQMDQQIAMQEEQAAAILQQLDLAQSRGSLPADLNPEAVRTNLRVALKAQKLGRELIVLTRQPGTPERQRRIAQITAEMTGLQRELRKDVMVAAGTPTGAKR